MNAQAFNTALQVIGATITYTATRNYYMVSLQGYDKHFELCHYSHRLSPIEIRSTPPARTAQKTNDSTLKSSSHDIAARFSDYIRYGERAEYRRALTRSQMKKLTPRDGPSYEAVLSSEVDIHTVGLYHRNGYRAYWSSDFLSSMCPGSGGYTFPRSEPIHTSRIYLRISHTPHSLSYVPTYSWANYPGGESVAALFGTYFGSGMGSVLFKR